MPVEIKELVIRAVVDSNAERPADAPPPSPAAAEEREALVEAAVKEVLRILRTTRER